MLILYVAVWLFTSQNETTNEFIKKIKRVAELNSDHTTTELLSNLVLPFKTTQSTNKTINPPRLPMLFWMLINNILERRERRRHYGILKKSRWRSYKTQTPGRKMSHSSWKKENMDLVFSESLSEHFQARGWAQESIIVRPKCLLFNFIL